MPQKLVFVKHQTLPQKHWPHQQCHVLGYPVQAAQVVAVESVELMWWSEIPFYLKVYELTWPREWIQGGRHWGIKHLEGTTLQHQHFGSKSLKKLSATFATFDSPLIWVTFQHLFALSCNILMLLRVNTYWQTYFFANKSSLILSVVLTFRRTTLSGWWLNQPLWKILWVNLDHLPQIGVSKNRDTSKWMVYNGKPY